MLIPVEIVSFALDPGRNTPVMVLKETNGNRTLAIPVGPIEASAIAIQSLNVSTDKPLTIDLVKLIMEQLGGALTRIVIHELDDKTLSARLQVTVSSRIHLVECRPSDALALSLRCEAPLFVKEAVLTSKSKDADLSEAQQLQLRISSVDTLEFGRYILE